MRARVGALPKLAAVMHAERSGGKWRMKDVRMLLFMHWARSIDAIPVGQLMFDDFSAEACCSKLKKVRKILGKEAIGTFRPRIVLSHSASRTWRL